MGKVEFDELLSEKINKIIDMKVKEKLKSLGISNEIEYVDREWMNLKQSAKYVGVCVNTIKKFETMGLKVSRIGRTVLISKSEIDRYLTKHSR